MIVSTDKQEDKIVLVMQFPVEAVNMSFDFNLELIKLAFNAVLLFLANEFKLKELPVIDFNVFRNVVEKLGCCLLKQGNSFVWVHRLRFVINLK